MSRKSVGEFEASDDAETELKVDSIQKKQSKKAMPGRD
jgi:hypothetical protein